MRNRSAKKKLPNFRTVPYFGFRHPDFGIRISLLLAVLNFLLLRAAALDIQLPPEVATFRQNAGAEIANAQCLICHSVEYVTMQPPMPRTFWKNSIQKMQQKYGAPIPNEQVDALADYLTANYGPGTNAAARPAPVIAATRTSAASDGPGLAMKYGCLGCHNPTTRIIGPAYREIALKYKSDAEAAAKIDQQIHKGGSGKWGPIVMPPFPQISPAETKALAEWILGLK